MDVNDVYLLGCDAVDFLDCLSNGNLVGALVNNEGDLIFITGHLHCLFSDDRADNNVACAHYANTSPALAAAASVKTSLSALTMS